MNKPVRKPAHNISGSTLNKDPNAALRELINLSKKLLEFSEQETQALVMGDLMRFACAQQEKEELAQRYTKASEEFRNRIEEFRNADVSLLNMLDKLQVELKQKAQQNNTLIDQVRRRAQANTKATLFTAQELGQHRVSFANTNQPAEQQKGV